MARDFYETDDYHKALYGIYDDQHADHTDHRVEQARGRDKQEVPRQDCGCCDACWPWVSSLGIILGRSPFGSTSFFIWVILSLLFWVILWSFASSVPTERVIQLWPGETWEMSKPPLWPRMSLGLNASSADPGIEVYEFSPATENEQAKCPLPTLQAAKHYKSTKIVTLQDNEYQYDYFHLNVGSQITVDLRQQTGSVNVYLLQGYGQLKKLQQLQQHYDFRATSILKRFSGKGGQTTFTYLVQDQAELFILVYDNATPSSLSSSRSSSLSEESIKTQLTVNLEIDMTTHLLPVGRMVCSAMDTYNGGCLWDLQTDDDRRRVADSCIIVKAVSSQQDSLEEDNPITVSSDGDDQQQQPVVQVILVAKVGSRTLWMIACLPLLVALHVVVREYVFLYWWRRWGRGGAGGSSELSWRLDNLDQYQPVSTKLELDRPNSSDVNKIRSYQHS